MSEDFLLHWPYLDEVYYRPVNFTDHCFKIPPSANIGTMACSNSKCVTVIEPRILAETSCTRMPAHKLLPPRLAARSSNRTVELCWCAGQLCNYYPSVAINKSPSMNVISFSSAFLVLVILLA
ncbi:Protein CBG04141 [Caenorhabditis briggsae]|uniref:Protein CBG04141 n=1 Tax=Caenorhabditis briggsae TaxID=6238 RepID=A8WVN5_CAEBR|nr:Protein CBG04141 [Caenorhabditis briggsae]CAP24546.2 Protein CBG04141 [Caenorhabditis briggsae]